MQLFAFQGKLYVYDKIFKPNATQESVYNMVAKPIVKGMYLYKLLVFSVEAFDVVSTQSSLI